MNWIGQAQNSDNSEKATGSCAYGNENTGFINCEGFVE